MKRVKASITLFEYDYLGKSSDTKCSVSTIKGISDKAFEYLEAQCLSGSLSCLRLKSFQGQRVLQTQNYAGVIVTPFGDYIEILPKLAKKMEANKARQSLLHMLSYLGSFRHLQTQETSINSAKMPLLEVFISQFLDCLSQLVTQGLRSHYVAQQENTAFVKGKLLIREQLRHNFINRHHFFTEYDEYMQNRPENRLLHTALSKVGTCIRTRENQRKHQELRQYFEKIPLSSSIKNDMGAVNIDRSMKYYRPSLSWAELILNSLSPLSMRGSSAAFSLLFPMEAVFESYVASLLRKDLPDKFSLKTQAQDRCLTSYDNASYFRLKPDLLIQQHHDDSIPKNHMVLDTKWKMINSSQNSQGRKFGLSQDDFYQLFAYGHKYLSGSGCLVLIYPYHEGFQYPLPNAFEFSDREESLQLWVVPFKIGSNTKSGQILWPAGLSPYHLKSKNTDINKVSA